MSNGTLSHAATPISTFMALNKGLSDKYCSHSASNEYPQHMFLQKSKKNINTFWLKKKNKSGAMLHGEKKHSSR